MIRNIAIIGLGTMGPGMAARLRLLEAIARLAGEFSGLLSIRSHYPEFLAL